MLHCVKPGPQKEENISSLPPSVRVRVCFLFLRTLVVLGIHYAPVLQFSCSVPCLQPKTVSSILSHVMIIRCQTIFWAVAGFVYSQVSRLSLSMCDPERTVSISIRRSELRPSEMEGMSSSPSDIGSTGMDSCKVIEGVSPDSPEVVMKDKKEITQVLGHKQQQQNKNKKIGAANRSTCWDPEWLQVWGFLSFLCHEEDAFVPRTSILLFVFLPTCLGSLLHFGFH